MKQAWNILVVDDEDDIHQVTALTIKRKKWDGLPFNMVSAHSAAEARAILSAEDAPRFDLALVDVVMETSEAGLELCGFIRAHFPRSLRIILRTGQPGVAPKERVLREHDVDYYLSKTEATLSSLYTVIRVCLRMSQEISTHLAFRRQMHGLISALQTPATEFEELLATLHGSLDHLAEKHFASVVLVTQTLQPPEEQQETCFLAAEGAAPLPAQQQVFAAVKAAHAAALEPGQLHPASAVGLEERDFVLLPPTLQAAEQSPPGIGLQGEPSSPINRKFLKVVERVFEKHASTSLPRAETGGVVVRFRSEDVTPRDLSQVAYDVTLFLENWLVAYQAYYLSTLNIERVALRKSALAVIADVNTRFPLDM